MKKLLSLIITTCLIMGLCGSIINVYADVWSYGTTLTPRTEAAGWVINNKLLVVWWLNWWRLGILEIYDPSTNTWSSTGAGMPTQRSGISAWVINNKLYVVGWIASVYSNKLEIYDPLTNTWSSTGASMPTARYWAVAWVINNKLYVAGWSNGSASNKLEIYDPLTNTWSSTGASMPTARYWAVAWVINNKLYVAGWEVAGWESNKLEIYDPLTNTWSSTGASMPTARGNATVGVINNKLYVAGWNDGSASNKLEIYDPLTNTWSSTGASMPTARYWAVAWVINNKMYVAWWYSNIAGSYLWDLEILSLNTSPTISSVTVPSYINLNNVNSTPFTINWITDPDLSQTLTYKYSWDNSNWIDVWTWSTPLNNINYNFNLNTSWRSEWNNILYVKVNDWTIDSNVISSINIIKDTTAPTLIQITSVSTPTNNVRPVYVFSSTEAWIITYSWSCSSTWTTAVLWTNTVAFNTLSEGIYNNCSLKVTDSAGNVSTSLNMPSFTIDTTAPVSSTNLLINWWALFTNNPLLNLQITHPNDSDVYWRCVSESNDYNSCSWTNTKPTSYNLQ